MMSEMEKSDLPEVAKKRANKAAAATGETIPHRYDGASDRHHGARSVCIGDDCMVPLQTNARHPAGRFVRFRCWRTGDGLDGSAVFPPARGGETTAVTGCGSRPELPTDQAAKAPRFQRRLSEARHRCRRLSAPSIIGPDVLAGSLRLPDRDANCRPQQSIAVEGLADTAGEIRLTIGFVQQGSTGIELAVVHDSVFRISGGVEHMQRRLASTDFVGKLRAV